MTDSVSLPDDVTEAELAAALAAIRRSRQTRDEETIHVRGEGGAVFEMTPSKMSSETKRRLQLGYLRRVNADGSPYREPVPAGSPAPARAGTDAGEGGSALTEGRVPRPAKSAPKRDWVLYGVTVLGLDAERAEGMTRQELIDLPPDHALYPAPTPGADQAPAPGGGMPDTDAPKAEWIDYVVKSGRISREDAEAYTKDDLIDMVG